MRLTSRERLGGQAAALGHYSIWLPESLMAAKCHMPYSISLYFVTHTLHNKNIKHYHKKGQKGKKRRGQSSSGYNRYIRGNVTRELPV
jgi:hypothetical protein